MVYVADVAPLSEEARFRFFYEQMPPYRQKKIAALKPEKSKRLSLGAGVLLNAALRTVGIDGKVSDIEVTLSGKPFIKDRDDICFNLSHSGERVMCAIAGASVGCDVEKIGRGGMDIAHRYFTASECETIASAADAETMFCRLWTLKESFVKAIGTGLGMPLNSFNIVIDSDGSVSVTDCADAERFRFYEWSFADGYCYACCLENGFERPALTVVDLTNASPL